VESLVPFSFFFQKAAPRVWIIHFPTKIDDENFWIFYSFVTKLESYLCLTMRLWLWCLLNGCFLESVHFRLPTFP
jgi:hypothetical protein